MGELIVTFEGQQSDTDDTIADIRRRGFMPDTDYAIVRKQSNAATTFLSVPQDSKSESGAVASAVSSGGDSTLNDQCPDECPDSACTEGQLVASFKSAECEKNNG